MVWLPLALRQLDVLQLIPVWGILWTWDATWQHCRQRTWRSAIIVALACGSCFAMSVHHGLFMVIALGPALLLTMKWRSVALAWKQNLVAIILTAVLVGWLALPMRAVMRNHKFERSQQLVTNLSARPRDMLRLPQEALVGSPAKGKGFRLSPGWGKFGLALLGVCLGMCRHRRRRWTIFLLLTVALSALLSLGPNLQIGSWEPWWPIAAAIPGLQQARNIFRFFYLSQIGIILLCAVGLSETQLRLSRRLRRPMLAAVVTAVLGIVCVIEIPPPNHIMAGVPDLQKHLQWTEFVRENTQSGRSIVCLPFAPGRRVADFATSARWMYYGTLHGVPMLNGYSGFFPPEYFKFQDAFNTLGLTDEVLSAFCKADVDLVVIHRSYLRQESVSEISLTHHRLQLVHSDDVGIDVYRLTARNDSPVEGNSAAAMLISPLHWMLDRMHKALPSQQQ